jgi:hypothetical protein
MISASGGIPAIIGASHYEFQALSFLLSLILINEMFSSTGVGFEVPTCRLEDKIKIDFREIH